MTKIVTKAVLAAAGLGTRFLPQTKAMPKEMLPVFDKPLIQWIVEELVDVGVTDIIIVTGPNKRAIEDHFDRSVELEQALYKKDKDKQAEEIKRIAEMANFVYVRQKGDVLGTALPALNAAHLVSNEPFFYFEADGLISGNRSRAKQMLEAYQQTGKIVNAMAKIDIEDSSKFGMASLGEKLSEDVYELKRYVEKPKPEDTPSDYMLMMAHLFTPEIFNYTPKIKPTHGGELYMADAVDMMAADNKAVVVAVDGEYLDCGNHLSYLRAQLMMAAKHKALTSDLLKGVDIATS